MMLLELKANWKRLVVSRLSEKGRLHAARAAFTKVRHDRELFEAAGIGPGDSYLALWSHLIEMRNMWHGAKSQDRKDFYLMRYSETLRWLLPYERPRLAVVKVKSDADNRHMDPETMARALAKSLTPEELELLDRVALKLVSAPGTIDAKAEPAAPEPPPGKRRR
jgi:hypothetical protein